MNRRKIIETSSKSLNALLNSDSIFGSHFPNGLLINFPDKVYAIVNEATVTLRGKGKQLWTHQHLTVSLKNTGSSIAVLIQAPGVKLSVITLQWKTPFKNTSIILNDHWERTYGDVSWHAPVATEILRWHFLEYNGENTHGFGVKTGTRSFCSRQISNEKLSLVMDTRSGGSGVQLGDRKLQAAEMVTIKSRPGESSFQTARRFMKIMCVKAKMPKQPVYGINDWYFCYGNNSEKLNIEHTEMMAPMADGISNRPFSVIDAGWFQNPPSMPNDCCWGDNLHTPDDQFADMGKLADKIKIIGMRPGIWTRPLCRSYKDAKSLLLPMIKGREANKPVLDPTIPQNAVRIKSYFKLYNLWGYEMVKFDFTSFDMFGKWGFEMLKDGAVTADNWSMYDKSKTNAEILLNVYTTIYEAAGETYIIGCNSFSHLSAGLFKLNRMGDDTSGNEWARTRKMGVNTLAFRSIHQEIFYKADGDCVGLTPKVAWDKNKQWLEPVIKSGTLFLYICTAGSNRSSAEKSNKILFQICSLKLTCWKTMGLDRKPVPPEMETEWEKHKYLIGIN